MCRKEKRSSMVNGKQYAPCTGAYAPHHCGGAGAYGGNFRVDDPVQGPIGDCYLISALASIAWANPARLNLYPNYTFLGTKNANIDLRNNGAMNVLLDAQGNPAGAKLGINNDNWPLLYEKAYAVAQGCVNWGATNCPDVSKIGGGVGFTALKEVYRTANGNSFIINFNQGVNTMVNNLNACTAPANGKAFRAAVAWTGTATNEIQAGHTYSYLGYYRDPTNNYYLVLRNPCRSEPTTNNVAKAGNWLVNFANLNDGIFALKFSAINKDLNIGYVL
jgi:hypothetical protein